MLFFSLIQKPSIENQQTNVATANTNTNTNNIIHTNLTDARPDEVCSYLSGIGIVTEKANGYENGSEYCFSPYKELGSEDTVGLRNNIAYYVVVSNDIVTKAYIALNVNKPNESKTSQAVLLRAASTLLKKALNEDIPKSVKQAITKGKAIKITVKQTTVTLSRETFSSRKGYSLHFTIKSI